MGHTLPVRILVAIALISLAPGPAQGVGTVLGAGEPLTVTGAEALLTWSDEYVSLDLRLSLPGDEEGGIWLLPVPGGATLEVISGDELDALAVWDAPSVTVLRTPSAASGCGGTDDPEVLVTADGTRFSPGDIGGLDEVGVLSGPSVSSLKSWLEEQNVVLPESLEEPLEARLLGDVDVVWAVLSPEPGPHLSPTLHIRFHQLPNGKQPLPLGLTRADETDRYDVLMHVLADKRFQVENYPSIQGDGLAQTLASSPQADDAYVSAVDAVADEAGGRLVVLEAAHDLRDEELDGPLEALVTDEAFFLTRLRLRAAAGSVTDATVAFAKEGPEVAPEVQVVLDEEIATALLVFLALGGLTRRRRSAQV